MEDRCWFVECCFCKVGDAPWRITIREHGDTAHRLRERSEWVGEGQISEHELHDIEKVMDALVSHNLMQDIGVQRQLEF